MNVANIETEISAKEEEIKNDLKKFEPALLAAKEALSNFPKKAITEFKNFTKPPEGLSDAVRAVLIFLSNGN